MKNLISQILYDLFADNQNIEVPGIGFFCIAHKSASYNAEKKTICPPQNLVTFKNSDKQKDNILVDTIAQKAEISKAEARETIDVWVNNICMQLAENGECEIDDIGKFYINDVGQIGFVFANGNNIYKDIYGLTDVEIDDLKN